MKYQPTFARDYRPSSFLITAVDLEFTLNPKETLVRSRLSITKNPLVRAEKEPLKLDGVDLELVEIKFNQQLLSPQHYKITPTHLIIEDAPENFTLEILVKICPEKNLSCSGLYLSSGNFCTQNEPHGFRHITYFLDRSDVLTTFSTTIIADREQYPVLLSNGNLIEAENLTSNLHKVRWHDPFPKAAYLFALVAGKFAVTTNKYVTQTGQEVELKIFVSEQYLGYCDHAMQSLKRAMRWEEQNFGLSYDLALYQIVGIDDFNFGAMENKGLNIFNNELLLTSKEMATDRDFKNVAAVIAHEYFHNWTGNRVGCRDWFQIGLKEGLTTLREELFTEDNYGKTASRIESISILYNRQFPEDAGPLSHPIRLTSYIEVNNFYTATVYEKSAEVARMLITMFGYNTFCTILRSFLNTFDGMPATIEDFLAIASKITQKDLTQFKLWYDQSGTPVLEVTDGIDEQQNYYVDVIQKHPQAAKDFYLPLALGLINEQGDNFYQNTLLVSKAKERFHLTKADQKPTVVLLQNFSAPVKIEYEYSLDDLLHIAIHAQDPIAKWEAGQKLATSSLITSYHNDDPVTSPHLVKLFASILDDDKLDGGFGAHLITLPTLNQVIEMLNEVDVEKLHRIRESTVYTLAKKLENKFLNCYNKNHSFDNYELTTEAIAKRTIKNISLRYLAQLNNDTHLALVSNQLKQTDNLTDLDAALTLIANSNHVEREQTLHQYYQQWKNQPNLFNQWLAINASIKFKGTVEHIRQLLQYPEVSLKNPSNVYALIRTFAINNLVNFHAPDGSGYRFLGEQVMKIDKFNSQLAATIATSLAQGKNLSRPLTLLRRSELERIYNEPKLSTNLYEIISKALTSGSAS